VDSRALGDPVLAGCDREARETAVLLVKGARAPHRQ